MLLLLKNSIIGHYNRNKQLYVNIGALSLYRNVFKMHRIYDIFHLIVNVFSLKRKGGNNILSKKNEDILTENDTILNKTIS